MAAPPLGPPCRSCSPDLGQPCSSLGAELAGGPGSQSRTEQGSIQLAPMGQCQHYADVHRQIGGFLKQYGRKLKALKTDFS